MADNWLRVDSHAVFVDFPWRAQDTYVSKDTTVAARLACGAAVDVALALAAKQATHGAALVRPPGHHVRPLTLAPACAAGGQRRCQQNRLL